MLNKINSTNKVIRNKCHFSKHIIDENDFYNKDRMWLRGLQTIRGPKEILIYKIWFDTYRTYINDFEDYQYIYNREGV